MLLAGCGYEAERGVGLERVGDDVVAHFVLCRADRVTEFRLTDYGLSYGSGLVGPVLWELRSDDGERIERIRFGEVPAGFDETVRYHDVRSVERVVVSDHNGDDMMSYAKEELGAGGIWRADYIRLGRQEFRRAGRANCRDRVYDDVLGLGLTTPAVLAFFFFARELRRRTRTWIAHALASYLLGLAVLALAAAAAVWIGALASPQLTGRELALGLGAAVFWFGTFVAFGSVLAVMWGAVVTRRRGPTREPARRRVPWLLMALSIPLFLALAGVLELIRPWTVAL